MSELCKTQCVFYEQCSVIAEEDPKAYDRAFRQMIPRDGMHTEEQITLAQELIIQGDSCRSDDPSMPRDCRIISSAILKNLFS